MNRFALVVLTGMLLGIVYDIGAETKETGAATTPCVGYTKITVTRGAYVLAAVQFDAIDGGNITFGELVGDELPAGSRAITWNKTTSRYRVITRGDQGWPNAARNLELRRGTGLWFHVPANVGDEESYEVVLMGRVPNADMTYVPIVGRWNFLSYPYPADMKWLDTRLAARSRTGAVMGVWDTAKDRWQMYRRTSAGWRGAEDVVLAPGAGFIYMPGFKGRRRRGFTWSEPRPYPVCAMSVYTDMDEFIEAHSGYLSGDGWMVDNWMIDEMPPPPDDVFFSPGLGSSAGSTDNGDGSAGSAGDGGATPDHSDTNVQVDGVDEADIVKTDGKYIYSVTSGRLSITRAYPVKEAGIVADIRVSAMGPREMFVSGDRLLLFGEWDGTTIAALYDIKDRSEPRRIKTVVVGGSYKTSRRIGPYAYFVVQGGRVSSGFHSVNSLRLGVSASPAPDGTTPSGTDIGGQDEKQALPVYKEDGEEKPIAHINCIGKLPGDGGGRRVISIVSIHMQTGKVRRSVVSGWAQKVYCSHSNLYLAGSWNSSTTVHKLHICRGRAGFVAQAIVPGRVLNQFSMDEFSGRFRIATTDTNWRYGGSSKLHILDCGMEVEGALTGIAPGEEIYSARFMGKRAYLVTFKTVDPFFVIDVSKPKKPRILGELKIPGYSDYLHPMGDNMIMGIGKHAIPGASSNVAWYQGLKIAIYDVSDVSSPVEKHCLIIGDRGSESEALRDHRAFLYDAEKQILVLPARIAELPEGVPALDGGVWPNRGVCKFHGAIVLNVIPDKGIFERGRIAHTPSDSLPTDTYWGWGDSGMCVRRSLYIGDVLYTISAKKIKANDLNTLEDLALFNFSF